MGTDPILAIEGLCIAAGRPPHDTVLVKDVSLTIAPGEVLGLIGESGSGKSMTCLAVMDLLPPGVRVTAGAVRFCGRTGLRRGRDAAMVLQNPSSCFDPVMTILGHFRETVQALGLSEDRKWSRTGAALAEAGFDQPETVLPLYPFQLSGGMLQRVMLALAMLGGPKLLLADEPTTDLDMPAQAKALDLMDRLRRSHDLAVLLVTHDLSVAARLADRVAVMRGGHIVETGPVDQIFAQPGHPYTQTLLAAHFELHDALLPIACGAGPAAQGDRL
jgi:nickel transport system ATP-binding protein